MLPVVRHNREIFMRYVIAILAFFLAFSATAANKKKTRSRTRTQKQAQVRSKSKSKSKKAKPKVTAKAKPKPKPKVEPTPITFEQIDYYIKRFATQGLHRAGSKIDKRTARVLENLLKNTKNILPKYVKISLKILRNM